MTGTGIKVHCYSGYKADERPRSFKFQEREFTVMEIIDRWLEPGFAFFRVRADDRQIYVLKHDERRGEWELLISPSC